MTTGRSASPFELTDRRSELARLTGQIQTLTLELQPFRQTGAQGATFLALVSRG